MIIIDDIVFNVPVIAIRRRADFLDKFAERTADGKLQRELIGVYKNYQLQLGSSVDPEEYQNLWRKLTEPVEFHEVTVPDFGGQSYTFTAYFSNVGDELRKAKGNITAWRDLTVNFIARVPAV